jgi:hypothetical protein
VQNKILINTFLFRIIYLEIPITHCRWRRGISGRVGKPLGDEGR